MERTGTSINKYRFEGGIHETVLSVGGCNSIVFNAEFASTSTTALLRHAQTSLPSAGLGTPDPPAEKGQCQLGYAMSLTLPNLQTEFI